MAATASSTPELRLQPLNGRVAIVTGGAGGIGSAVSTHLASLGARVVIGYIGDPAPAQHLVSTINANYPTAAGDSARPRAIAVCADVSKSADVKSLFDAAAGAFGPEIHILVTAAAVPDASYPPIADTTEESFDWMFGVNAKGTFLCCREAANRLVRHGGGRIITFSSSGVVSLRPGYGAYAATKGAIEVFTKILARELRGTRITANAVAPGPTESPMFYAGKTEEDVARRTLEVPMGRLGKPEDVAPLIGFLASDAGEWVNAQVIRINGGNVRDFVYADESFDEKYYEFCIPMYLSSMLNANYPINKSHSITSRDLKKKDFFNFF